MSGCFSILITAYSILDTLTVQACRSMLKLKIRLKYMCGGVGGRGVSMGSGWRVFGRHQGK